MNFSRSAAGALNPISNRFFAAILATFAALVISLLGSGQWASADGGTTTGTTVPDPEPTPVLAAPTDVTAEPGDQSAAVGWVAPIGDIEIAGYIVTASPSGISVETDDNDTVIVVEGLENGTEYTFTVVAFNDTETSIASEPSNPVTPEEEHVLDEEKLKRLREHLRKRAHQAQERLHKAEERAREKLEKTKDRVNDKLDNQTDRANDWVAKARDQAVDRHGRQVEQAQNWFTRLKDQIAKRLERAVGTDRYDDLSARADEQLDKAQGKVDDRIEKSREKMESRIDKAEEKADKRIGKAFERAENAIERTEQRLTEKISKLRDRVNNLLERLAQIWAERTGTEGSFGG